MNQRRILLFSIMFLILFLIVANLRGYFNAINLSVNLWSASVNHGFFNLTAQIISIVFDTVALTIISLVVSIIFFVLHFRRYSLLLLSAMAGETLLVALFKLLIMSKRPLNGIIDVSGYSFPSGHTTSIVVFFGILTYFIWRNNESKKKIKSLIGGLYIFMTGLVGFDRIYLNVHWFSDIIGSVFLGAFWLALCILLFKYLMSNKKIQKISGRKLKIK